MNKQSIVADLPPQRNRDFSVKSIIFDPLNFIGLYSILLFLQNTVILAREWQSYAHYFFVAWSSFIVVYHLFFTRRYLRKHIMLIFALITIPALASIWLNREANSLIDSLKTWYLSTFIFTIFLAAPLLSTNNLRMRLKRIIYPLCLLTFLTNVCSLITFVLNISGYVFQQNAGYFWGIRYLYRDSGQINPVLYGIYQDSSYAAFINFAVCGLSILMLMDRETNWFTKSLLWLNLAVSCFTTALTNNRTNTFVEIVFIFALAMILVFGQRLIRVCAAERRVIAVALSIMSLFLLLANPIRALSYHFLHKPVQRVAVILPTADNIINLHNLEQNAITIWRTEVDLCPQLITKPEDFLRYPTADYLIGDGRDFEHISSYTIDSTKTISDNSVVAKRLNLWQDAIELVTTKRPWSGFGIDESGYRYFLDAEQTATALSIRNSVHNSYLQYLLAYGWLGLIGLVGVVLIFFARGFKNLINNKNSFIYQALLFVLMSVILIYAFLLNSLFEELTIYSAISGLIIGLASGNLFRIVDDKD